MNNDPYQDRRMQMAMQMMGGLGATPQQQQMNQNLMRMAMQRRMMRPSPLAPQQTPMPQQRPSMLG